MSLVPRSLGNEARTGACESQSAALKPAQVLSVPRLEMDSGSMRPPATLGAGARRHTARLWAEPYHQPLAPLTHPSAPLGERIWRGEKEGEKQAGCEGTRPTPV